jgi:hypothetical protein
MKKGILAGMVVLGLWLGDARQVGAAPLTLEYVIQRVGPHEFYYTFILTLDNHDGSWHPGQGFGWLIFGDAQNSMSPFTDFAMDPAEFPIGPWTALSSSGGYHNGPTFSYVLDTWVPQQLGDQLIWSGISYVHLGQGQMLYSSIYTTGGAPIFEFAVATQIGL